MSLVADCTYPLSTAQIIFYSQTTVTLDHVQSQVQMVTTRPRQSIYSNPRAERIYHSNVLKVFGKPLAVALKKQGETQPDADPHFTATSRFKLPSDKLCALTKLKGGILLEVLFLLAIQVEKLLKWPFVSAHGVLCQWSRRSASYPRRFF